MVSGVSVEGLSAGPGVVESERSSSGLASLNTIPAHQNTPISSSSSPPNADSAASSNVNPPSPEPTDPTSPGPTGSTSTDPTNTTISCPIDMEILDQILDLDEEDDREFSRGMAWAYFEQAASTFAKMDEAFADSSLLTLSELGHFLKGSSAALGVHKVQKSCEQIQNFGQLKDGEGKENKETEALQRIGEVLALAKEEYAEAERWLKDFFGDDLSEA